MAVKVKNQVKAESVALLSISAINKAETVLNYIPKVLEDFNKIKDEVEIIKADLNLGLAKYEAEINEKKSILDEQLASKQEDYNIQLKLREEQLNAKYKQMASEVEESNYKHKLAIDREDIETAKKIASTKGLALFDKDIVVKHESEVSQLEKKYKAETAIAISSAVKNAKEELNETIREKDTQITILNNTLQNNSQAISRLENEIDYLKSQLEASRKQTVDALAAAKVNITQSNQGK